MKKSISTRQFASVKRIAMNVNPLVVRKTKIINKINELVDEVHQIDNEIRGHETGIKSITGGMSSEQLIVKTVTDKVDKNGNTIKITKYEPNPDVVFFNEETKMYDIFINDDNTNTNEVENTTEKKCNSEATNVNNDVNNDDFQIDHFNL